MAPVEATTPNAYIDNRIPCKDTLLHRFDDAFLDCRDEFSRYNSSNNLIDKLEPLPPL